MQVPQGQPEQEEFHVAPGGPQQTNQPQQQEEVPAAITITHQSAERTDTFEVTGDLNQDLSRPIMNAAIPKTTSSTRIVHSFSCIIYRGNGDASDFSKTFPTSTVLHTIEEMRNFVHTCEQKGWVWITKRFGLVNIYP